jgi:hypothetical protein
MVVKHLVVDNTFNHVPWHVAPVKDGVDANRLASLGIGAKPDRVLVTHAPVGAPGNGAVDHPIEILAIYTLKNLV